MRTCRAAANPAIAKMARWPAPTGGRSRRTRRSMEQFLNDGAFRPVAQPWGGPIPLTVKSAGKTPVRHDDRPTPRRTR